MNASPILQPEKDVVILSELLEEHGIYPGEEVGLLVIAKAQSTHDSLNIQ